MFWKFINFKIVSYKYRNTFNRPIMSKIAMYRYVTTLTNFSYNVEISHCRDVYICRDIN